MVELHSTSRKNIDKGNFPLNHDCILKVSYIVDCPIRFQYFTCPAQHSGLIVSLFESLATIRSIEIVSVDNLPDAF